jgi:poly(3-hydroxybutyrate) depolymerase
VSSTVLIFVVAVAGWLEACSSSKVVPPPGATITQPAIGQGGTSPSGSGGNVSTPASSSAGSSANTGSAGATSPGEFGAGKAGSTASAGTGGGAGEVAGAGGATVEQKCDMVIPPSMDCSAKLAPGDRRSCMLGTRQYEVYAGKTLNPCEPVALVIDAHGATETAVQQAGEMEFCAGGGTCWHGLGSGWKAEADTAGGGFIVVFPQGLSNMWQDTDADFMAQIVDEMKKMNNIDPKKVYISGISNGGFLTYWTGCPHSDVFHGMSPNAGGANCDTVKAPIPVIAFDDMPDFAYQSSTDARDAVIKANNCKGAMKTWVTVDSKYTEAVCRSAKEDTMATLIPCTDVKTAIMPTVCTMWDQCDGGVEVVFCEVAPNDEHGNPGLDGHIIYENNTLLNTPSLAWRFFKRFW